MLYYTGLEEVIFSKHELLSVEPDELIIISGYIGPAPVERLIELSEMKVTIIVGMYPKGIDVRLFNSLEKIKEKNKRLTIKYTKQEIHSKIYIWKKDGKTLSALIGSANFSSNGLRTDYRESLADATRDTFNPLEIYYDIITNYSSEEPKINKKHEEIDFIKNRDNKKINDFEKKYSIDIPLYRIEKNISEVPPYSGLNWGRARLSPKKSHVSPGDAYIRIPKEILKTNILLFKPLDAEFITIKGKRKRNSDPIELIWDDGTIMEASLEGVQKYNKKRYPKQLASYSKKTPVLNGQRISKKSILGRYIRQRLDIGIDDEITIDTLSNYGRNTITLSLIDEGIYFADFSVKDEISNK